MSKVKSQMLLLTINWFKKRKRYIFFKQMRTYSLNFTENHYFYILNLRKSRRTAAHYIKRIE